MLRAIWCRLAQIWGWQPGGPRPKARSFVAVLLCPVSYVSKAVFFSVSVCCPA